jgi:hypothetical protein
MQFGRVEGFLTFTRNGSLRLTVMLDTRHRVAAVRDEAVPAALREQDPAWLADQLVQETLGNELAEAGWEVIGEASPDNNHADGASPTARSRCYIVRRV